MSSVIGWIGNALIISGVWSIGNKKRWGFLVAMSGGACWAAVGLSLLRWDLIFIETVMLCINCRNYIKWTLSNGENT